MNRIQLHDLGYSLRRHFVDQFHLRHVQDFTEDSSVLDLGGNRVAKRGLFDIDRYGLQVVYANLSAAKEPHVRTDAAILPFADARFDAVICSELLEHVPEPLNVVKEIHRVLKPKGSAIICVPFMNKIHGDPYDYGRYTDFFWNENLSRLGFQDIEIEKTGPILERPGGYDSRSGVHGTEPGRCPRALVTETDCACHRLCKAKGVGMG
jgi:SAM-dependent methyltransferase